MSRLGISIYPEKASLKENLDYIELASKYGFKRVFTCMLSATNDKETITKEYKTLCTFAKDKGMDVIVDVAPSVFEHLSICYEDLSFFHEIGATGIRLDEGFDGHKEAIMTNNPYDLKIEFNASIYNNYIDNILSYKAKKDNMITCHNFYPQVYSGLGLNLFNKCTKKMHDLGLKVAAFVSSNSENTFGPWPISEGLCTLEMHRHLSIDAQARHLFALGIDDVIIANCFASEEEMMALSKIDPNKLTIKINEDTALSDVEKAIVYDYPHFVRPDMSEYMARSTFCRITYKDADICENNTKEILHPGDVVVLNNNMNRYKGELHIILKEMPNDHGKNVIGHIDKKELIMLEYIEPFTPFKIIH